MNTEEIRRGFSKGIVSVSPNDIRILYNCKGDVVESDEDFIQAFSLLLASCDGFSVRFSPHCITLRFALSTNERITRFFVPICENISTIRESGEPLKPEERAVFLEEIGGIEKYETMVGQLCDLLDKILPRGKTVKLSSLRRLKAVRDLSKKLIIRGFEFPISETEPDESFPEGAFTIEITEDMVFDVESCQVLFTMIKAAGSFSIEGFPEIGELDLVFYG